MARAETWNKFRLLMWKNWVLQIRHPIQTVLEILVPVFFCVILVLIRSIMEVEYVTSEPSPRFYPENSPGNYAKNPLSKYSLTYSPNTTIVNTIMAKVIQEAPFTTVTVCEDSVSLENVLVADLNNPLKVGVAFPDNFGDEMKHKVPFTIRFPAELKQDSQFQLRINSWKTYNLYPPFQIPGPRGAVSLPTPPPGYYQECFLHLQSLVTKSILEQKGFSNFPKISMQRYTYPDHMVDTLVLVLKESLGFIIVIAFTYNSVSIIKMITAEKEKQLKESMKIMGLPGWLHWTAWFVKSISFMLITTVIMVILLKGEWYSDDRPAVFPLTDPFILFIFLFLYSASLITFSFAVSVFFSKANLAASIGGVLFFFLLTPFQLLNGRYAYLTLSTKLGASLAANTAMAYGFTVICLLEGSQEGLQWNNLFQTASPDDNISMAHVFMMLIIDIVLYMLIALYVEAIFPGDFGVPKKWHFIFTDFISKKSKIQDEESVSTVNKDDSSYENEPTNLKAGIQMKNLRKVFKDKVAVNGMSLNMYESQITVLLGHNGAGKTTTMSMLTGMITPTSGTALVNGFDLRTEIGQVRSSLGLCPQHNILFDELTVSEHIYFYSCLKGMNKSLIKGEIDNFLKLLQLEDKRNARARTLSGGMQRKLSVAVAFCGGSKVVMLDEPTSGMDPAARRALWEMVESQKANRTVMLTTHFMDEADLLGDRIAIMSGGELQCSGSSFFLKKRFGAGYHLILEKLPDCEVRKVTQLIEKHIPGIQVESNVGTELTYLLHDDASKQFEPLLKELEENLAPLKIGGFGISLSTMEEVFMKVGADNLVEIDRDDSLNDEDANSFTKLDTKGGNKDCAGGQITHPVSVDMGQPHFLTGRQLIGNQILAMFIKRFLSTLRTKALLLVQILIPILMLIVAIISARQRINKDLPALLITHKSYADSVTVLQTDDSSNIYYKGAQQFLNSKQLKSETQTDIEKYFLQLIQDRPGKVRMSYIVSAYFSENEIVGWFTDAPYHSPPLALNFIYNSLLKTVDPDGEVMVTNYPLPYTLTSQFKQMKEQSMGFQIAVNISFCMSFISAFFILFYIRERICKVKHLQFVSGANKLIFWLVSFLWDWLLFALTVLGLIVTLLCYQEDGYKTAQDIGNLLFIFVYFAFSMFPLIYVMSFWYSLPSTGFIRVTLYALVFGTFAMMIVKILSAPDLDLEDAARIMDNIFIIIPYYSLASGIDNTNTEYNRYTSCKKLVDICTQATPLTETQCWNLIANQWPDCTGRTTDYFKWERPGILRNVVASFLMGILFFCLLLLLEFKIFNRFVSLFRIKRALTIDDGLDEDVCNEGALVAAMSPQDIRDSNLVLRNVRKFYKNFEAVKGLNLRVAQGECFGLLGVNGAGKTTTFRMITGDTNITYGEVFVNGFNIKTNLLQVYKHIGYCPQFDALFDDLTGRETLRVFCLLRGIPWNESNLIAEKLAHDFNFSQHLDKIIKQMSGGNKRKISTAVALIGNPSIIYLDEPTTGMDPAAKRHLWNALCKLRDNGKCLILTTHSMEECEALCTRLAIMVNGQYKCLGSTQHLKNRFARGFILTIKLKKQEYLGPLIERVHTFVTENFPTAELREQYQEMITFNIPTEDLKWSSMFGTIEQARDNLEIEDYSIGQSSLEQVFLSFTKLQYQT